MVIAYGVSRINKEGLNPNCTVQIWRSTDEGAFTLHRDLVRAAKQPLKPAQISPYGLVLSTTFWLAITADVVFGDQINILSYDDAPGRTDPSQGYTVIFTDPQFGNYFSYLVVDVKGAVR